MPIPSGLRSFSSCLPIPVDNIRPQMHNVRWWHRSGALQRLENIGLVISGTGQQDSLLTSEGWAPHLQRQSEAQCVQPELAGYAERLVKPASRHLERRT